MTLREFSIRGKRPLPICSELLRQPEPEFQTFLFNNELGAEMKWDNPKPTI